MRSFGAAPAFFDGVNWLGGKPGILGGIVVSVFALGYGLAVILCSTGNPVERLREFGLLDSMKRVMLGDRLFGRAKQTEFIVFDNTSRENELREKNWDTNIRKAYETGRIRSRKEKQ